MSALAFFITIDVLSLQPSAREWSRARAARARHSVALVKTTHRNWSWWAARIEITESRVANRDVTVPLRSSFRDAVQRAGAQHTTIGCGRVGTEGGDEAISD